MTVAATFLPEPICPARDSDGHSASSAFHPQHLLCEERGKAPCQQTSVSPGSPSQCPAGFMVCLNPQGWFTPPHSEPQCHQPPQSPVLAGGVVLVFHLYLLILFPIPRSMDNLVFTSKLRLTFSHMQRPKFWLIFHTLQHLLVSLCCLKKKKKSVEPSRMCNECN